MYDWITILTYVLCIYIYIYTLSLIVYIIIYCPYIAHGTYQLGCTPYWGFLKHKNDLTTTRSVLPSQRGMAYWHMAQHGPPGGRIWHFQIKPDTQYVISGYFRSTKKVQLPHILTDSHTSSMLDPPFDPSNVAGQRFGTTAGAHAQHRRGVRHLQVAWGTVRAPCLEGGFS